MFHMQVIAMRLNVKLSPDQERQLLESSMVPLTNEEDHILVIETASAMPTPAAVQQLMQPPASLASPGPGVCSVDSKATSIVVCVATMLNSAADNCAILAACEHAARQHWCCAGATSSRGLGAAALSGKLVIPEWAGPTGSRGLNNEPTLPRRTSSISAGPHGYQPEFLDKETVGRKQTSASVPRRNSSALLLTAADGGTDSEGAGSVSRSGFPISRQSSSPLLVPGGSLYNPAVQSGGRTRRPSLLGLQPMHALPENDAYLGPPKAKSPRRTSSFLTSSGPVTRKGSLDLDHEAVSDFCTPLVNLTAQSDVMDASLLEPEIVDHRTSQPLDISRRSTSGSYEVASAMGGTSLLGAPPPVQVS